LTISRRARSLLLGDTKSFAPSVDDYVVLDPLLEKGKEAFLKSKLAKRSTEWSKGAAPARMRSIGMES